MRLYFIRHGQSENNLLYDLTGKDEGRNSDPMLTETGKRQAQSLADFLCNASDPADRTVARGFGITHFYSSLMLRAVATAEAIASQAEVPIYGLVDWHETGGVYLKDARTGDLHGQPGKTRRELELFCPRLHVPEQVNDHGWYSRPFELDDQRPVRARRALRELLDKHGKSDDRVAVVSHAGFFMQFLAAVIGLEHIRPVWFVLNNTGVSRFDFDERDNRLVYHNLLAHLPNHLVT